MIKYTSGNIFVEPVQAIVNTVNCVGVMGQGLALQFKQKYPQNFLQYKKACKKNELQLKKMFVHSTGCDLPQYIINFPTKQHWRGVSKLQDIEGGLDDLLQVLQEYKISSIALPPLGCGLGGLSWSQVKPIIDKKLASQGDVYVVVFEPQKNIRSALLPTKPPAMTPGRAVLVELMHAYLKGLLDPFVTLLEVHKLMYFMQEAGEDLKLRFVKHHYGPYASNLRHVLQRVEGHFIKGYQSECDAPSERLHLTQNSLQKAEHVLKTHHATKNNLDKVVDLIEGFETSTGLELLATVHWLIKHESVAPQSIVSYVHNWSARKQQFSPNQINLAYKILRQKTWL